MALRSPTALSLGARYLYGSLARAGSSIPQSLAASAGDASSESQHEQRQQEERASLSIPGAPQLGFAAPRPQDDKPRQPTSLSPLSLGAGLPAALRSLQPLAPTVPSLGARKRALLNLGAPKSSLAQQQVRGYNAWSPASRYFVEGDHVVTAEANRTFQFTGLDSGSFYPYILFTIIATGISCVFIIAPLLIAPSRVDLDKSSAYECGFDAFGEARQTFSVSFYLVSIMYLLFDIEIAYLFPYAMTHASVPEYWTMNLFLAILVGGFAYEWGMGALEWRE